MYATIDSLDTPCLALDADILERNLGAMQTMARRAGKNLRPHAKTHKCSTLTRRQIAGGAVGVCVAKVSEAEALARAGIENILVTGPVATRRKCERLAAIKPACPGLMAVIDSRAGADLLSSVLTAGKLTMDVLIDVDIGLHRTGVAPACGGELAAYIAARPALRLRGIQAYAGHVQHIRSYSDRREASLKCLGPAAGLFRELRASFPGCDVFSASGTGTCDIDMGLPEVTEIQPGSYVCMDTEYAAVCPDDGRTMTERFGPALRLLTTVISANQQGFVTVDAGLKALYRDGGFPAILGPEHAGLRYEWFGDEYGKIIVPENAVQPAVGTILAIAPSHCDPTINLFDVFHVTRGRKVVDTWPIDLRGCCE